MRNHAITLHNRSLELLKADPAMSYRCAVSAVEVDRTFAEGWMLLGNQLSDMGNLPAACAAFRAGLACEPEEGLRLRLLVNLGHRLMHAGDLEDAERVTDEAIRMYGRRPAPPEEWKTSAAFALTNRSLIYSHRGLLGASTVDARRGFEMFPEPITEMGLAFALLFEGNYAEGLRHFDARFDYKLPTYINLPWPRWDRERDRGKSIVVMCEQGLGDSVSFARFIPEAARHVERLIFQVQPELTNLLSPLLAHVSNVEVIPQDYRLPPVDAWCPVFGLPTALDLTTEDIRHYPGLPQVPGLYHMTTPVVFDPKAFNVAVAWGGSPANDIDKHRSFAPSLLLPLAGIPGVRLHSVQVGPRVREMHEQGCVAFIRDLSPNIRDAADTAAILQNCDLVVTCESFVGHLAGLLDIPCIIAASRLGRDWRLGIEGPHSLWYRRHRVARQGEDRSWAPVFREIEKMVRDHAT
jgi:tetratricopeptide (TPR) repeat protein